MKKLYLVLIPLILINLIYTQSVEIKDSDTDTLKQVHDVGLQTNKNFHITPYLGSSTLVGNFGVEFQYKNYGYNIGIFKDIIAINNSLCGGIRYYFKPYHHSLVFGIGGGITK